jgi:hypothetical protein
MMCIQCHNGAAHQHQKLGAHGAKEEKNREYIENEQLGAHGTKEENNRE